MSTSYLVDTSAWIEFFLGTRRGERVKELLESDARIDTLSSSLAELYAWCLRDGVPFQDVLVEIRSASHIQEISLNNWIEAAHIRHTLRPRKPKIGIMDALLLSMQQVTRGVIVTKDNDFRGLPDTILI